MRRGMGSQNLPAPRRMAIQPGEQDPSPGQPDEPRAPAHQPDRRRDGTGVRAGRLPPTTSDLLRNEQIKIAVGGSSSTGGNGEKTPGRHWSRTHVVPIG